jgi:gluconolactonase
MRTSFPTLMLFCLIIQATDGAYAQDMPLSDVLIDGQGWVLVAEGYQFTEGPAVDSKGQVFFTDIPSSKIYRIDLEGQVHLFAENTARTNGLMFGPDGKLYGCRMGDKQIVAYAADGTHEVIVENVDSNDLVVTAQGEIFFTDPPNQQVWHVSPTREKQVVVKGFRPNGIILTPDGGTLVVTDSDAPHLWAFRVEQDGKLSHGEKYFQPLRLPPGENSCPGSDGMIVDKAGRIYVATRMGLQMFDPTGRMGGVIAKPHAGPLSNVTFGGPELNMLYATCGDKVFRRLTKTQGVRDTEAK